MSNVNKKNNNLKFFSLNLLVAKHEPHGSNNHSHEMSTSNKSQFPVVFFACYFPFLDNGVRTRVKYPLITFDDFVSEHFW